MAPLPPLTLAQLVEPSADCCHWIVPVCPLRLIVVVLPVQIVLDVAVPPTDVGLTVVAVELVALAAAQPLALV